VEVNGFDYFDTTQPANWCRAARRRSPCGRWTPTTTGAACSRARCSSRWPGKDDGWNKLKKDIRAELDEELLEQFHGTVSLPFEAGENANALR
jgi:adenine-specific DNA-methyltransferase